MNASKIRSAGRLVVLAGVLSGGAAFAQASTATDSATATASVVAGISITNTADLNFGEVVAGAAGSVVMSTAGARSITGGTTLGNAPAGTGPATFTVGGDANATYSITLPAAAVTLTRVAGSETMSVTTFTSNPNGTGTIGAGGSQTLSVGATLVVGASQVSGTYNGSFDVTVTYN